MGYTTEFQGTFKLNKPLEEELFDYLNKFSETRRMKRDPRKLESMGYGDASSFGTDGEFFVEGKGFAGQDRDDSIIDYNSPPRTQPELWCQWVPTEDKMGIEWDGGEKFYSAAEWIQYIISNFLAPKGYVLNGIVNAQGEEFGDIWHINIQDNVVKTGSGHDYIEQTN